MRPEKRILLVNGHPESTGALQRFLEDRGFCVSIARDGYSAILKLLSGFHDVVLLASKLPDMPNMEFSKYVKDLNEDTAVILINGNSIKQETSNVPSRLMDDQEVLEKIWSTLNTREIRLETKRFRRFVSLDQFFPFLAYKIRNPLQAITGALAMLKMRLNSGDDRTDRCISIIHEEINHLLAFIQESHDFVRPPSKLQFVPIEVNTIVEVVLGLTSFVFKPIPRGVRISKHLGKDLPRIHVDYDEIKKVLFNLVKNGLDAMPDGGDLVVETRYRSSPAPGWIEIIVADTGVGVRKEDMEKLFRPFFTTKLKGMGLGLATCYRIIVERHRGEISILSEEGEGTQVRIQLPVIDPLDPS